MQISPCELFQVMVTRLASWYNSSLEHVKQNTFCGVDQNSIRVRVPGLFCKSPVLSTTLNKPRTKLSWKVNAMNLLVQQSQMYWRRNERTLPQQSEWCCVAIKDTTRG